MTLEEYQKESRKTARYKDHGNDYIYPLLGLVGEVGEVVEAFKKLEKVSGHDLLEEDKKIIKGELGDLLWYISQICSEIDLDPEEVADYNIKKINLK